MHKMESDAPVYSSELLEASSILIDARAQYSTFNRNDATAVGWYWLLPSRELKLGSVKSANVLGYELAVYRGADGRAAVLDAYCPHMGAHLSEGKVEGNQLRCFFHNWCFDSSGNCTDIPSLAGKPRVSVCTKSWIVEEVHDMIWIWLGNEPPSEPVPAPPELEGGEYISSIANHFIKNCHPNVVMINAIDEQHFQTVHHLPGQILLMEPSRMSDRHIRFYNQGSIPTSNWFGRLLKHLYKNALTYDLDYWYGSTGTVTLGPDFLHMYLMFTLRMTPDGKTDGYAIVFARKPKSWLEKILAEAVLLATKIAGCYFAQGDTRIFQTIRFNFKTPIQADRAVISFIQHLEKQDSFPRQQST